LKYIAETLSCAQVVALMSEGSMYLWSLCT